MAEILSEMRPALSDDCCESDCISPATTAKPFPASPALAASIDALRERRFVCEAMSWISVTISPISPICAPNSDTA